MKPPPQARRLRREAGFALACLAVWMLALLAPLHQASRLTNDLRLGGLRGLSAWTLCLPGGLPDEDRSGEGGPLPVFCPAQAVAHALDAPPATTGLRLLLPRRLGGSLAPSSRPALRRARRGRKQPRAPPFRA